MRASVHAADVPEMKLLGDSCIGHCRRCANAHCEGRFAQIALFQHRQLFLWQTEATQSFGEEPPGFIQAMIALHAHVPGRKARMPQRAPAGRLSFREIGTRDGFDEGLGARGCFVVESFKLLPLGITTREGLQRDFPPGRFLEPRTP